MHPSTSPREPERSLRKKSSFLSTIRGGAKSKSQTVADDASQVSPRNRPSPKKQAHSNQHARSATSPTPDSRLHEYNDPLRLTSGQGQGRQDSTSPETSELSYTFPSSNSGEDPIFFSGNIVPNYQRMRTWTTPSSISKSSVPPLRFSGFTQAETPPQTPTDSSSASNSFEGFPVVVSAPVAGVETMDALVDGMNGFGADVFISRSASHRSRFGIPGHHPLYQPPLPTPPPGVTLGGGKVRKREPLISSDEEEDRMLQSPVPPRSHGRRTRRPSSTRTGSTSTIVVNPSIHTATSIASMDPSSSADDFPASYQSRTKEKPKTVVPSISEIIRTHAPPSAQVRSRPSSTRTSLYNHSQGHTTVNDENESEPEPLSPDEEAELISRSSIDSIADEVQRTFLNQKRSQVTSRSLQHTFNDVTFHWNTSDAPSFASPTPDGYFEPTSHASSLAHSDTSHNSPDGMNLFTTPLSTSEAIAEYLRSLRLTTLVKLTRHPHASATRPLTVSLSDMGDPNGFPLVVFLGLGCVRHIMGLYDEMADCLGLRLITIDRWGLGRTEVPHLKSERGIMEWASVVEEVLDLLHIDQCSVMAHSAGAPYALSFANRVPERIRGDVCLLAPWVGGGESGGYKWLKYVPNGILKTAQAAEWKIQAWMIGKPPTVAYRGIGYTVSPSPPSRNLKSSQNAKHATSSRADVACKGSIYPSAEIQPRPSVGSGSFSEYDDLRDFEGRFESQSTLGARSSAHQRTTSETRRKSSKSFLGKLKTSKIISPPQSPPGEQGTQSSTGKRLKALRSMSSLKGKSSSAPSSASRRRETISPVSPQLPATPALEFGLGLGEIDWNKHASSGVSPPPPVKSTRSADMMSKKSLPSQFPRSAGRRSISFSATRSSPTTLPSSPVMSTLSSPIPNVAASSSYQAALGNALIAASHAESAKGTHSDLLQILNHDHKPWGFSYSTYPHRVLVWYGDRDEKIAENAVRWMERNMGIDRCHVKVVQGADHALMYKSAVVVEVLERVREFW